jgi:hypothetical protein
MKKLTRIHQSSGLHWVGNGFPVRSVFDGDRVGTTSRIVGRLCQRFLSRPQGEPIRSDTKSVADRNLGVVVCRHQIQDSAIRGPRPGQGFRAPMASVDAKSTHRPGKPPERGGTESAASVRRHPRTRTSSSRLPESRRSRAGPAVCERRTGPGIPTRRRPGRTRDHAGYGQRWLRTPAGLQSSNG